jgi:hypothetical protein
MLPTLSPALPPGLAAVLVDLSGSRPIPPSRPLKNRPRKSGKWKVVAPSPFPQFVPIIPNKSAYIVLLTADPSHNNQPTGMVDSPVGRIVPVGTKFINVI